MIEIIIILAVAGSIIAGLWDLKTTEVPDPLPIGMVAAGIIFWVANWIVAGELSPLLLSLGIGTVLLAAGMLLYSKGQWGGADAWILAAIGYMIPVYNGNIFIVPYLFNFMLVSIAYTVIYSVVIGLLNRKALAHVAADFKANIRIIAGAPVAVFAVILGISFVLPQFIGLSLTLVPLVFLLVIFWRYAVVVEKHVFKKKIPVGKLRVGDVLEKGNWVGLTESQVRKLRREKRYVVIKDGMRFVPVFAIALVLTLLYGNMFFAII
ncbi:MAG: hypothetical protein QT00_C0001G0123 [archaeon GW2011_AR5]|nr:MAG: hypothetical protein QT00_C0001G0123 [archaeon GW2011_AR5]